MTAPAAPRAALPMSRAALTLGALVSLSAAGAAAQEGGAEERIRSLREASNAAIARHDVDRIVALLDEEFQLTAGAGTFIRGRNAMGEAFRAHFVEFDDIRYVRTPDTVEVGAGGAIAWERGTWVGTWTAPAGPVRTGGRYAAYWRTADGAWKIRSELFVTLHCGGSGCP